LKRPCQKSLPPSLFQREESLSGSNGEFLPFIPLWKRGMKGDFTTFQKAKLLPCFKPRNGKQGKQEMNFVLEPAGHREKAKLL
jgi:hypothetical protein